MRVLRYGSLLVSGAALGATAMVVLIGWWIEGNIRYYS